MGVDNLTLFTSGGGGGAAASDYLKDAFDDISIPATNNTGFSSTVSTNPINNYFGNDDAPKYGSKTLWVKDLVLVQDRSQWVNNRPLYKVIWNEQFPGVDGYVYGNVRLRNSANGISVDIRNVDDAFGVGGVIRRVQWILNPTEQTTGTADLITDGADTSNDAIFGSYTGTFDGYNHTYAINHQNSNETKNIHDFRIQANEYYTLNVAGVTVYFENATSDIDCFPGSTYVNKDKKTTTSVSALSIPAVSGRNGSKVTITKTAANTYQTNELEVQSLETVAVGTGGANTVTVTTGQGASFPIGTGVVINTHGTSYFVGSVTNVSTDTLTLDRNLPFGVSGPLYKTWRAGATLPIGATTYALKTSIDMAQSNVLTDAYGFGDSAVGNLYYTDPYKRFRMWGSTLLLSSVDGLQGIVFGSSSMLQISGDCAAAEFEVSGSSAAILHATFTINGVAAYGINEGFTGQIKRTFFTDGAPGWKEIRMTAGSSMGGLVVSKINLYEPNRASGITFGLLAEFNTMPNPVVIGASSNITSIGTYRRVFSDELYLTGAWGRTLSPILSGGAGYQGASTNSTIQFGYYGKDWALLGQGFGSSMTYSIDGGAATGMSFNVYNSVATEGFHTLTISCKSITAVIEAIDFTRTKGEVVNLQNYLPRQELDDAPKTYIQSDTPRNPKNGDFWLQKPFTFSGAVAGLWMYVGGLWNQIGVVNVADDPNAAVFIKAFGSSTTAGAGVTQDSEHFNGISWTPGFTANSTARYQVSINEGSYQGFLYVAEGFNSGDTAISNIDKYNKISWSAVTQRSQRYIRGGGCAFNGNLYADKGTTDGAAANGSTNCDKFNGTAWANTTAFATAVNSNASFVNGVLRSSVGGNNTSGTGTNTHETKTTADANGTATVVPANGVTSSASKSSNGINLVNHFSTSGSTTAAHSWNGTSWTTVVAQYASVTNSAFQAQLGSAAITVGGDNGSVTLTNASTFNGVSFSSANACNKARGIRGSAGSI